jgi:hypothetical protein
VGRLAVDFARPARGLRLHNRHTGPIHLHIQDGNRLSHDHRQIQLHGPVDLLLLPRGDIGADGLGVPLYRFGRDLQSGQQLHLFAPAVEGRVAADHGLHPANTGGEFGVLHVQFDIGGKLSLVTVITQVIGAQQFHAAHCGQDGFGA